ncbi:MAG: hypothetical protein LPK45_02585 [Bacteroidota bacterium]|nr:hypothetical protein [Bacteroidota bacterium]MDX5429925.1 hypothetical protein [Bacteroidota bacterium]MDX5468699.1 hypothetical protein [Bacteroidota bacterium]
MNLLILGGTMATCLFIASCVASPEPVVNEEATPTPEPKSDPVPKKQQLPGPRVELRVSRVSVSGQNMRLEIINRTGTVLNSVKGMVTFYDKKGNKLYDSLQMRDFQPFSAYKLEGLVAPHSKSSISVDVIVPAGCKEARVILRQASHADGTVMQFKPTTY